jgi:hypothetical protein
VSATLGARPPHKPDFAEQVLDSIQDFPAEFVIDLSC